MLVLACAITISSMTVTAQTRRRQAPRRRASAATAPEKSAPEIKAARERVAAQLKTLTRFLYLFGGIAKDIQSVDQASRTPDASAAAMAQNERNKTRVRESIRNVREGLDKLESDFRFNPALKPYYVYLNGVARLGEAAENQAAANRFDEAGKTLLKAAEQLADGLAAMR
jgi:hypothetical protein